MNEAMLESIKWIDEGVGFSKASYETRVDINGNVRMITVLSIDVYFYLP
jgi:hypothetical protein